MISIQARVTKRWISTLAVKEKQQEKLRNIKDAFAKVPTPFSHFGKVPEPEIFRNNGSERKRHLVRSMEMQHSMPVRARTGRIKPDAVRSFERMGLHPQVMVALKEMEVETPSAIQQLSIPVALEGKSTRLCAATGTGKTIAMMTPVFNMMMKDRAAGVTLRKNRPRFVVLAPTNELVHQLWSVASKFGRETGFEVRELYGNRYYVQKGEFDVIIGTPSSYRLACERGYVIPIDVKYFAIDEADLLLGGAHYSKAKETDSESLYSNLIPLLEKQFERDSYLGRHKVQFLLASAAVTQSYESRVNNLIPHVNTIVDPNGFHVSPLNTSHNFLIIPNKDKYSTLIGLLGTYGNRPDPKFQKEDLHNKMNFWFPDAITFESGKYGPLQKGSFVASKEWRGGSEEVGEPLYRRLLNTEGRQFYKQDYSEDVAAPKALPAPPSLILPGVEDDYDGEQSIVPIVNQTNDCMVPVLPQPPVMTWGHLQATAGPFTGLPPLCPQRSPLRGSRVIIFFQSKAQSIGVARQLTRDGYRVSMMHNTIGSNSHNARTSEFEKWASGECNILITTDIASRGLDFPVDQVINFDLPKYPAEYLLRAGRTGRMGRRGMVQSLVVVCFLVFL